MLMALIHDFCYPVGLCGSVVTCVPCFRVYGRHRADPMGQIGSEEFSFRGGPLPRRPSPGYTRVASLLSIPMPCVACILCAAVVDAHNGWAMPQTSMETEGI